MRELKSENISYKLAKKLRAQLKALGLQSCSIHSDSQDRIELFNLIDQHRLDSTAPQVTLDTAEEFVQKYLNYLLGIGPKPLPSAFAQISFEQLKEFIRLQPESIMSKYESIPKPTLPQLFIKYPHLIQATVNSATISMLQQPDQSADKGQL